MYASRVLIRASRNVRSSSSLFSASSASRVRSSNPSLCEPQNKATLLQQTAIKPFGYQRQGITTTASAEFIKKKEIHVGAMARFQRITEAWVWHINQGVENILADYVHNGITRNATVKMEVSSLEVEMECFKASIKSTTQ